MHFLVVPELTSLNVNNIFQMSDAIRTYLVEDHLIVRQGLKDLFKRAAKGKIVCVGEAVNEAEAMEGVSESHPDVVVVDLNLDNSNGISLIEKLKKRNPNERIVVYSMRSTVQTVAAAYRLGALAYVTKSDSPTLLLDAIQSAHSGKRYFVPGMTEKLAEYQFSDDKENPLTVLSEKELELFVMLADGVKMEEAAKRQGITARSAANRVVNIRKSLHCGDADFTRIASKYGLINSI